MIRQDKVYVQKYAATETGSIGQKKYTKDGAPVPVSCNVYPLDTAIAVDLGLLAVDSRLVVCDEWPGDLHSIITFEGDEWLPETPPKTFNKSWAARSVQLVIKRKG